MAKNNGEDVMVATTMVNHEYAMGTPTLSTGGSLGFNYPDTGILGSETFVVNTIRCKSAEGMEVVQCTVEKKEPDYQWNSTTDTLSFNVSGTEHLQFTHRLSGTVMDSNAIVRRS